MEMRQVSKVERTTLEGVIEGNNVVINVETDGEKPMNINATATSDSKSLYVNWSHGNISLNTSGYSIEEHPSKLVEGILLEFQEIGVPIESA